MNTAVVSVKARPRGLFVYSVSVAPAAAVALAAFFIFIAPDRAFAQAPTGDGPGRNLTAARTAPAKLPPTQESVRRGKMRAQIKIEGENKFRYARELEADGYLVRSRQLLEDFLILFPGHDRRFAALQLLARIAEQQDQAERAVSAYRRAYASVPGEDRGLEAALQAGRLLASLGRTDEARDLFLEIQGRKPDSKLARLVQIELQALGLPVVYDRFEPGVNGANGNYTTETTGDVGQNSTVPGNGAGPGQAGDNSDRGLLDGTVGVPTNDGTSSNSAGDPSGATAMDGGTAAENDRQAPESADRENRGQNQSNPTGGGSSGIADEALQRMGEGVERPRSR